MEYVFPNQGFEKINDLFMLGDMVMVAPVLQKGMRSSTVVFPKGKCQIAYGSVIEGGCKKEILAPLHVLPIFKRL